jgi:hypothetical protein
LHIGNTEGKKLKVWVCAYVNSTEKLVFWHFSVFTSAHKRRKRYIWGGMKRSNETPPSPPHLHQSLLSLGAQLRPLESWLKWIKWMSRFRIFLISHLPLKTSFFPLFINTYLGHRNSQICKPFKFFRQTRKKQVAFCFSLLRRLLFFDSFEGCRNHFYLVTRYYKLHDQMSHQYNLYIRTKKGSSPNCIEFKIEIHFFDALLLRRRFSYYRMLVHEIYPDSFIGESTTLIENSTNSFNLIWKSSKI